jgi:hypothetical protein
LPHVPSEPDSVHDSHAPAQARLQQTPWAQKADWHSEAAEQDEPGIFLPHEFPLQTFGARQLALVVHAPKQAVPLHAKGLQGNESGAVQRPEALHVDGGVYTFEAQVSGAQMVPGL